MGLKGGELNLKKAGGLKTILSIIISIIVLIIIVYYSIIYEPDDSNIKVTFEKVIGEGDAFAITSGDNHLFILGENDVNEKFLGKYNLNGNNIWNVTICYRRDTLRDLFFYNNNIYVTGAYDYGGSDIFIMKYNPEGNLIWNKTWKGNDKNHVKDIIVFQDKIYLIGRLKSNASGWTDSFLVTFDINGNYIYNKTWSLDIYTYSENICVNNNYLYILGGIEYISGLNPDLSLVKMDLNGTIIWNKTWGGTNADFGTKITSMGDKLFVTGMTYSYGSGGQDLAFLIFDEEGNILNNLTWGNDDWDGIGYIISHNSKCYVAGSTRSYKEDGNDLYLLKYSKNAKLEEEFIWNKYFNTQVDGITEYNGYLYVIGQYYDTTITQNILLLKIEV